MAKNRLIIRNEQKEDEGGGDLSNKVSYDVLDNKTETDRNRARSNLSLTSSSDFTFVSTNSAINNLVARSPNIVFTGTNVVLSGIETTGLPNEIVLFTGATTTLTILKRSTLSSTFNRIGFTSGNYGEDLVLLPNSSVRLKKLNSGGSWLIGETVVNDNRYVSKVDHAWYPIGTISTYGVLNNIELGTYDRAVKFTNATQVTGMIAVRAGTPIDRGRTMIIAGPITVSHNNTLSDPDNRFFIIGLSDLVIPNYGMATFIYEYSNNIDKRWQLLSKNF